MVLVDLIQNLVILESHVLGAVEVLVIGQEVEIDLLLDLLRWLVVEAGNHLVRGLVEDQR